MKRWRVLPAAELAELAPAWRAAADAGTPLADHAWLATWIEAFQPPAGAAVHALLDGDRLIAALPLLPEGKWARALGALENEHWPYWTFPWADPDDAAAEAILDHVLAGTDYLFLRRLHQDGPACRALVRVAGRRGLPTSLIEAELGDAIIDLAPTWPEMLERLSKNITKETPRKQRRLEKLGKLEFAVVDAPGPALEAALDECFDVETRGWKGVSGSPIRADAATLHFYGEVARRLAATGRFALYLLRVGGKIVAFEYCLRGGGQIEMLKLSFDPQVGKESPGNVLRLWLLEREIAAGQVTTSHLGRPSEWKLRWATQVQPLCTLRVYAPGLRGRAAYLGGPALRARIKETPALARLVERARRRLR